MRTPKSQRRLIQESPHQEEEVDQHTKEDKEVGAPEDSTWDKEVIGTTAEEGTITIIGTNRNPPGRVTKRTKMKTLMINPPKEMNTITTEEPIEVEEEVGAREEELPISEAEEVSMGSIEFPRNNTRTKVKITIILMLPQMIAQTLLALPRIKFN